MNEVLIRKAKKGDKDAFCRLMDENVQSMYKIAAAYLKMPLVRMLTLKQQMG